MLKTGLTKHWVRLCRPRFETAVIEVQAHDEDDARARVVDLLADDEIPEERWQLYPFDSDIYAPHVEQILSAQDVEDHAGGALSEKLTRVDEFRSGDHDYSRYLLLLADTYIGEGTVVWQPWFETERPQVLEYDLATDWLAELDKMRGRYV